MSVETIKLGDALKLFNGKAPALADNGEVTVFGSNGIIGKSEKSNHPRSIILGRVGAYCGAVKFSEKPFWASDNTIVVRPVDGHDLKYWYYKLLSMPLRGYAGGAAQPLITHSILKPLETKVHLDANSQKRIASVLSAYDDLIENNRRRIGLLEEAARLLYREWFVHFRFPGHEHTKIIDGVPEGWELGTVGRLANVKSGYAFKSRDWLAEGHPVIKIKNITGGGTLNIDTCDFVSGEVAEKAKNFKIESGSLLIAMTGATVGKVGIFPQTQQAYYLNQRVGIFRSTTSTPIENFLYPFFQEEAAQAQVRNLSGGAAQPNISGGQIESIRLVVPSKSIFDNYLDFSNDIFEQRENLLKQIEYLTKTRDLLLPRLMDGRLEI